MSTKTAPKKGMGTDPTPVELNPSHSRNRIANIRHITIQLSAAHMEHKIADFKHAATHLDERKLAVANGMHPLDWAAHRIGVAVHWVK